MSQKTKDSKVRKLLRFLTFLLLTIFTVIVLFGVYITFFFPIKTVQNYLVKFVRNEYQRELVIGDASFHLLHGFEFKDITIHKIPDSSIVSNDFPVLNASVDKILLKYNLRKIFKKQLVVEEIVINSPDVTLQIEPTPQTIPVDSIKSSAADTTVPAPVIPIAFNLKTIKLSDLSCDVTLIDSVTMRFSINNVNLTMSDFNIPAGNIIEQDSLLHGQMAVQCKKSHLSFLQKAENDQSMSATSLADLEFDVNLNSLTDITSAMNLSVSDFKFESNLLDSLVIYQLPFPVFLNYQAELNAKENRVNVSELQFGLGGQKWLSLSADVKEYNKNPEFQLKIDRGTIPVQKVIEVARSVIPDSLMPNIFFAKTNPVIDLSGTKIWGHVPDSTLTANKISFIGNAELKNVNSTINQGQGEVEDLHLKVEIQGAADYFGLQDATSQVTVAYDSVFWAVNDTLSVFTGPASLHLTADINNRSVPENIKMEMTVSNLLNSNLTGNVHLYSATDLFSLRGDGLFELYDIDFNSLPQNVLQSRANVRCGFQVNTLDSLSAFVRVITDSLIMPMEYERISFPPLHVASSIKGAVDTTFSDFNFDSCIVKVGRFFEANARVKAHLGDQVDFNASVTDAFVDHAMLFNYIPENFKTAVQDLVVSGKTHVTADVSGFSRVDSLFYNAVGKLYTQNLGVEYPSQFIYINNLLLNINTSANSEDGIFLDFKLNIDTTRADYLPMSVFLNNKVEFSGFSKDFNKISISDGFIDLPDFKIFGKFSADADSLISSPVINSHFELHQAAYDTIFITQEMKYNGLIDFVASVNIDSQLAVISADLQTHDLSFSLPMESRVRDIDTDLKIHQKFDIANVMFLGRSQSVFQTPTGESIDYLIYRSYYKNKMPNMSRLSVGLVEAAGYKIENFALEGVFGDGRVDIPLFQADIYGGNAGGNISVDLANGDLSQTAYNVSAQFSGINSTLLVPQVKVKGHEGIINANLNIIGKGLDPEKEMDLTGGFYITEIGPRVADNLLRSLDPEGRDFGIRSTRILINRGFKPKLFSFEIRHGYFYPSVKFSQPFYFPVRLSGGQIELARFPIAFALKMAKTQSQLKQAEF